MKTRMRTLYIARSGHDTGELAVEWKGDCARWASDAERDGMIVTATRVLWVGKPWGCGACFYGTHRKN